MNERGIWAAAAGFAFVAAWIGFSFGEALLCLLGAALAWVAVGVLEGRINLGELQSRLNREDDVPPATAASAPRPRPRTRPLR